MFRLLLALAVLLPVHAAAGTVSGTLKKWHPVAIDFAGPVHDEMDSNPNPFLDYRLQVEFTAPRGQVVSVPGFFDGDGEGGGTGSVWRVHFSPDEAGSWSYQASFRAGTAVAVSTSDSAGSATSFDGDSGSFSVAELDPSAEGFLRFGRLESIGDYYPKFRDGGYWVKGGINNPENFLGYVGFDGTFFGHHDYADHVADWRSGDPDWDSPDAAGSNNGRGIIGALNYLAQNGINSIYFMGMNIGGDGRDAWPYADPAIDRNGSTANDNLHFDVSKLAQWAIVLEHAQRRGVALHIVLSETEDANKRELDNGTLGNERKLFYRELIARFGHHNALQWNISEEYNLQFAFSPSRVREFGEYIAAVDPYDHPITVHPHGNTYASALEPFLGDDWFKVMSVQTWQQPEDISDAIEGLRSASADAGNPVPIGLDESIGMNQISATSYRKQAIWDALLSGGHFEIFKSHGDSDVDDFSIYQEYMEYLRIAREFVESELPFTEMAPQDELVTGEDAAYGGGEVFAKVGESYAVYLPSAKPSATLSLSGASGEFEQRWFDPRLGIFAGEPIAVSGGGSLDLGEPPYETDDDWVVLVRSGGGGNAIPSVQDQQLSTPPGVALTFSLAFDDVDGPGPNAFAIEVAPQHGALSSVAPDGAVTYTPDPEFTGIDRFDWRVNDGVSDSATASVRILVGEDVVLLEDHFDRPNGAALGEEWVEVEGPEARIELLDGALHFADTSDRPLGPIVKRSFARVGDGLIEWEFVLDWVRSGNEGTYRLFMQLGDGDLLNDGSEEAGVGVNLVWTRIGGAHASLGSRVDGVDTLLAPASGPTAVRVRVDLLASTYDVEVEGAPVASGLSLEQPITAFDQVRFFTDALNEINFAGRRFDDVLIRRIGGVDENRAPQAEDQSVDASEDTPVAIDLQASDADGDPVEFVVVSPPPDGALESDDGDSMIRYVPDPGFVGTDQFSFVANDGEFDSNVATVTVSVQAANDAPVARDQMLTTLEGEALSIALDFTELDGPGPNTFSIISAPQNGSLSSVSASGTVVYTPAPGFAGSDGFAWLIHDGQLDSNVATATVLVQAVSGPPVARDQQVETSEGSAVAIGLDFGPGDGPGPYGFTIEVPPQNGTLSAIASDGTLVYTPTPGFSGSDSFDWLVNDGQQNSNVATASVLIEAVNDAPLARDQSLAAVEDTPLPFVLDFTDLDGPGPNTFSIAVAPQYGTLSPIGTDGAVVYTPAPGVALDDSFVWLVNDGLDDSGTATVSISIAAVNDPPVAVDQDFGTSPETPIAIPLDFSDADGPGPNSFTIVSGPQNGSLSAIDPAGTVVYTPAVGFAGADRFDWRVRDGVDDSNTATVYIAVESEVVLLDDAFDRADGPVIAEGWVESEAPGTGVGLEAGMLQFTTTDQLLRPIAQRSFARTGEGILEWEFLFDWRRSGNERTYRVFMQLGDGDQMNVGSAEAGVGVNLVWTRVGGVHEILASRRSGVDTALAPAIGATRVRVTVDLASRSYAVAVEGEEVASGIAFDQPVAALDRVRFFTDALNDINFTGRRFDDVLLRRPGGVSENRAPVATDQSAEVPADAPSLLELQASDPDGDLLEFVVVTAPSSGVLQSDDGDAGLIYVPDPGFTGPDHFTFLASDGTLGSNVATVSLSVEDGNAAPSVADQMVGTSPGVAVPIALDFADPDGPGPYGFTVVSGPSNGVLSAVAADGSVVYTPSPGFAGADSFDWSVNDGREESLVATVQLVVSQQVVLLEDAFDRPDSATLENGWTELELIDARTELIAGALSFSEVADQTNLPVIRRSFAPASSGVLEWEFLFDWRRTGTESTYRVFMQLGDSGQMNDDSQNDGIGVNLVWSRIAGVHQTLGSRRQGIDAALGVVSGPTRVLVTVDLEAGSYSVALDGVVLGSALPFDQQVGAIDSVRFFTDALNDIHFAARRFDDVRLLWTP